MKKNPITSNALNGTHSNPFQRYYLTTYQVPRRNNSPNLQRRQHPPNIHPPPKSPQLLHTHDPHPLHRSPFTDPHKLPGSLPTLQPPRHLHHPPPLHTHQPPHPPAKQPLHIHLPARNLQPYLPHHRRIPHAVLNPLVKPRHSFPNWDRLSDRSIRRFEIG